VTNRPTRNLDLTFVGTGNAFAPGGLCWNGFLADRRYLFDVPPQTLMSLNKLQIDPNAIEAVILSHHHGDHFLGLPILFLHWEHMGRKQPVRIIGPRDTEKLTRLIGNAVFPGFLESPAFDIEWIDADPGRPIDAGDLSVESVPVKHDPMLNQTLGYKCELGGRRFGYTGDSAICDAVLELARFSQVLVSECASRDMRFPVHMNLVDDMPRVRAALDPDATLVMTHIGPNVDTNGLPNTIVAKDFETYQL
jgi:ribonuclease BN (tRNA processing enzyme)